MSLDYAVATLTTKDFIPFMDINPFTITFVGKLSDQQLDLKEVFHQLPITETSFKPKAGKKVKVDVLGHPGAIIGAKYKLDGVKVVRGIDKLTRPFNNCISMIMTVPSAKGIAEKNIDFKLFKDKIQSTGSRTIGHTEEAWRYLKGYLLQMKAISVNPIEKLEIVSLSYKMIDKTFGLGFKICREKLKTHIHLVNGFHVIWVAGVHSNGVSVKYPLESFDGALVKKRKQMPVCVSFIVFATGSVIISGNDLAVMERVYNLFNTTIAGIRSEIELKIIERE
jgi:hypothetical protein